MSLSYPEEFFGIVVTVPIKQSLQQSVVVDLVDKIISLNKELNKIDEEDKRVSIQAEINKVDEEIESQICQIYGVSIDQIGKINY